MFTSLSKQISECEGSNWSNIQKISDFYVDFYVTYENHG